MRSHGAFVSEGGCDAAAQVSRPEPPLATERFANKAVDDRYINSTKSRNPRRRFRVNGSDGNLLPRFPSEPVPVQEAPPSGLLLLSLAKIGRLMAQLPRWSKPEPPLATDGHLRGERR